MNKYSNYWDKKLPDNLNKTTYFPWLHNFKENLNLINTQVLDLGCGNGNDTEWLINNGYKVSDLIENNGKFNYSANDMLTTGSIPPRYFDYCMSCILSCAK